jgi:hypothetical protein
MKVYVAFDFPGVDPDSEEANDIIECMEIDLHNVIENDMGYMWYIDDAMEDE